MIKVPHGRDLLLSAPILPSHFGMKLNSEGGWGQSAPSQIKQGGTVNHLNCYSAKGLIALGYLAFPSLSNSHHFENSVFLNHISGCQNFHSQ